MSRTHAIRTAIAILAIAFFATPTALRAAGVRDEAFENRRFADAPKLSQGWDAFGQTTQFLIDRMPLRARAVEANTRIWTDVFDTDPRYAGQQTLAGDQALPFAGTIGGQTAAGRSNDNTAAAVETGQKGWLYNWLELSCESPASIDRLVRRWGQLAQAIREAGHRSTMLVAPYKASVYPEYLPDEYPSDECALESKTQLWRALARDGPAAGIHELRTELLRLKEYAGDGLFERRDTHWSTLGAMTLVGTALEEIGGDVRLDPEEIVDRGMVTYRADLDIVGGYPQPSKRHEYGIARAPGAPRVPGRTLLICDSFGYKWIRLFKPYFEHIRYVSWTDGADEILKEIARSDRVIVEVGERVLKAEAGADGLAATVSRKLGRGEP